MSHTELMRRLGQHFLFDPAILKRIRDTAQISVEDLVIEIGPGHGRLTRMLAEKARKVIAIELDSYLARRLKDELSGYPNIEVLELDALKFPYDKLGPFKVVSNIPYYITTPIIFKLLEAEGLQSMTLTVQKEVAKRIVAVAGTKDYGVLSIMVQYRARPEIKFFIPKGAFRPVPKVDSAVIYIERLKEPLNIKDEEIFRRIVRGAFSRRRKTLMNALKGLNIKNLKDILKRCHIEYHSRPESLTVEEFIRIADKIKEEGIAPS